MFIKDQSILKELELELTKDCKKLERFLDALYVIKEISPRSKDVIIGTGEKLSCRIVSAYINSIGLKAELVDLGDVITENFSSKSLEQPFYDHLSQQFSKAVGKCKGSIPVITGFFGPVPGSLLTSIGRGYTDLAAALVAVGVGATELQIWKEVDGIFTADPRKVKNARLLPIISPEEAAELTYYGSEVIHPFTMEQVMRARIPIRIKNVQNPSGEGSIILPNNENDEPPAELFLLNGYDANLTRRHPTAVTIKEDMLILNVHSNRKSVSHDFFANLFTVLDAHGIVVDLISTSEVHVSLAISHVAHIACLVKELSKYGEVEVQDKVCILSLVGKQMRNMVGIAAQMFSTLAEADINIEMISQGSSEINISCVIPQSQGLIALNSIHKNLLEY
ncbi:aspartate kinase [Neoconidiobolus thromboides FSU 785]|nr:aspartate kinase [Neoconidiobolus thromboides FSU 785]